MAFHWVCPFCGRDTTIQSENIKKDQAFFTIDNIFKKYHLLNSTYIVCPNIKCMRFSISVTLGEGTRYSNGFLKMDTVLKEVSIIPESIAKVFPPCVPKILLDDYKEACLIKDLSPKASATLSRRCLQGVLRDFWKVKPGRLVDEIDALESKIEPEVYNAIDSLRKLGNIGAHMEKDINTIIDVDPKEAELLLQLLEMLFNEWYVAREERIERLMKIKAVADSK